MTSPEPSNSYSSSGCCCLGPALIPHLVSTMLAGYVATERPDPSQMTFLFLQKRINHLHIPSEKLLIASLEGDSAKNFNVTLGSPSRIIRCTMMSDLKTIVHVESLNRFCNARNISATPASPACVATNMCSTYLDLGAASYLRLLVRRDTLRWVSCPCLDLRCPLHRFFKRAWHVSSWEFDSVPSADEIRKTERSS